MESTIKPLALAIFIMSVTALSFALTGCGGGGDKESGGGEVTAIYANSELVVGPNRFSLGLIDDDNTPILNANVHFQFISQTQATREADARFEWAIPDVNGLYVANVNFDTAGQWQVNVTVDQDGKRQTTTQPVTVREKSITPNIGEPAPPTENLTLASDPNIKQVSTDTQPDEALYQMTVTQALQAGKPFVVTFATPAFCQTRFCGLVLENVKEVSTQFRDSVNFIHIEPFQLDPEGGLVTTPDGAPAPVQSTLDWKLQTEPWVFVVGADGVVTARFEGTAGVDELAAAIQQALGA